MTIVQREGDEWVRTTVSSDVAFGGKSVIVGIPGAFTPTCSSTHLPEYIERINELKERGVTRLYAFAVNDPFVLTAFAKHYSADEFVAYIADGSGDYTKKLNLGIDLSEHGLGFRARRFSGIIENNRVVTFNDEKTPALTDVSRAVTIIAQLNK